MANMKKRIKKQTKKLILISLIIFFVFLIYNFGQSKSLSAGIEVYYNNPHYLAYNGEPLFLLGYYNWYLIKDQKQTFDHLDKMAQYGLNYARFHTDPYKCDGIKIIFKEVAPGIYDLDQFDQSTIDHIKNLISYANEKGIILTLSLFDEVHIKGGDGCYNWPGSLWNIDNNQGEVGNLDRDNDGSAAEDGEFYDLNNPTLLGYQEKYVRKILEETSIYPNIIYEIGNELRANSEWVRYWVNFIRDRCGNLIQVNDEYTSFDALSSDKVDIASYHISGTGCLLGGNKRSIDANKYSANKVLIVDTDCGCNCFPPEGESTGALWGEKADLNRKMAWLSLLKGANYINYQETYPVKFYHQKATYFRNLMNFLKDNNILFWGMRPNDGIVKSGTGYVLANLGQEYVVYLPNGGSVDVDLSDASGTLNMEWFNPREGTYAGQTTVVGGASRTFTPPFSGDVVLHLRGNISLAPTISSVTAVSATQVDVVFSEPVEQSSAENTGNYAINPDITINGATLASDLKTVHLSTSSHTEGVTYTITINNIKDRASTPNIIASNSTATYTFHQALIVSNLSPSSYQTAYLGVGDTYYIDRDYLISSIPQDFEGLLWIKTANDDKASTGDVFLTFDINQNAMVYVAYDATISTLPDWLSSWLDLGVSIITTDTQLNLYSQEFAPGTVTLGGNCGGYHDSMYVVLIRSLAGVDTTPPAPPTGVRVKTYPHP